MPAIAHPIPLHGGDEPLNEACVPEREPERDDRSPDGDQHRYRDPSVVVAEVCIHVHGDDPEPDEQPLAASAIGPADLWFTIKKPTPVARIGRPTSEQGHSFHRGPLGRTTLLPFLAPKSKEQVNAFVRDRLANERTVDQAQSPADADLSRLAKIPFIEISSVSSHGISGVNRA